MYTSGGQKKRKNQGQQGSLREAEIKKRQVYKPILDNPYTQSNNWPYVEPSVGKDILDLLCKLLEPLGNANRIAHSEKQRKQRRDENRQKEVVFKLEKPEILPYLTIGFNSTVEALELKSKLNRGEIKKLKKPDISLIFVCKADIQPPLLTQGFPILAVLASTNENPCKLVQLPRNSIERLSAALNQPHTGIVGVNGKDFPGAKILRDFVMEKIGDVNIEWLNDLVFQQPNIKLINTTQPIMPKKNDQKAKNAKMKAQAKQEKDIKEDSKEIAKKKKD
ncbi:hypothetical protein PACTADRAFT_50763 [Pachysolen tannophilus NRRL Y-2460]|uniref:Uncharacterized protein n=1 Tax=Pachysolen tannophilus NRRL Y-2460 TaxID=669874 RepID=A0A1E4TT44_PACTA|nr:hypothetical protein PACTADRAFT_50763 [Pachysolen tannophilus NRRL Y-2460]